MRQARNARRAQERSRTLGTLKALGLNHQQRKVVLARGQKPSSRHYRKGHVESCSAVQLYKS